MGWGLASRLPPPTSSLKPKGGGLRISDCSPDSISENICFFSGWGRGEERRKQARGDQGLPFRAFNSHVALGN